MVKFREYSEGQNKVERRTVCLWPVGELPGNKKNPAFVCFVMMWAKTQISFGQAPYDVKKKVSINSDIILLVALFQPPKI